MVTVTGSESGSVTEAGTKRITVALSSVSERDITLYYSDAGTGDATSGSDYTAISPFTKLTTHNGHTWRSWCTTEHTRCCDRYRCDR